MYWAQFFRDNWNCYALSIFRVFILLESSDSEKRMLMRQKVYTKIRLYRGEGRFVRQRLLSRILGGTIKWFAPFMKLQKIWVVIGSEAMNLFYSFQSVQLIWICILRSGSFPPPTKSNSIVSLCWCRSLCKWFLCLSSPNYLWRRARKQRNLRINLG